VRSVILFPWSDTNYNDKDVRKDTGPLFTCTGEFRVTNPLLLNIQWDLSEVLESSGMYCRVAK
jgi:hypothetical protein